MKKAPHLLVSILTLLCPLSALAYSCQSTTNKSIISITVALIIFISLLLFILIVSYLINIKYFKTAIRNKKLFLITIAPLILSCLMFLTFYIARLTEEMRKFKISHSIPTGYTLDSEYLKEMCVIIRIKPILSSINLTLFLLFLCYLLIMVYGIYYLKKVDKSIGLRILKLCITVIVMTIITYIAVIIISIPIPGI